MESVSPILIDENAAAGKKRKSGAWKSGAFERAADVGYTAKKMTRRKSDGPFCLLILHNKLYVCCTL